MPGALPREVITEVRRRVGVPVLIGGPATDEQVADEVGADGWAPDGEAAATLIDSLRRRPATNARRHRSA